MSKFRFYVNRHLCNIKLCAITILWLFSSNFIAASSINQIVEVQVRPSLKYTRIVVKSDRKLRYKYFALKNPTRVVVDVFGVNSKLVLNGMAIPLRISDPSIISARIWQFNPKTIRIVLRIKKNVKPKLLSLSPASGFKERLFIDLYPYKGNNMKVDFVAILEDYSKKRFKQQVPPKQTYLQSVRKRPIVIMLDPGHGGDDYGAIGKHRTREKDIVLQIAYRLKRLIDSESNMRACMTRNKDVFIPLKVRIAQAKKQHSDLFVSIHADAFTNRKALGSSVFILSTESATSTAEKYLSEIKNTAYLIGSVHKSGDFYVDHTIFDMVQSLTITDSMKFGNAVLKQLAKINKLHKNNVEQAGFEVLKSPDIPSILVEAAFISNEEEEYKLNTEKFQQEIAESIFSGIKVYISNKNNINET